MSDTSSALDQLDDSKVSASVIEDFDYEDLEIILDDVLGEGVGTQLLSDIQQTFTEQGTPFDTTSNEGLSSIISYTLGVLGSSGGGEAEQLVTAIQRYGKEGGMTDEEYEDQFAQPVPKKTPENSLEAEQQAQELLQYFYNTFGRDSEIIQAANSILPEAIEGDFTPERAIELLRQNLQVEESRRANVDVLIQTAFDEWESGRADLPFDHPESDPTGTLKPLEEANNSPRTRDRISDNRIATRQIEFYDPNIMTGAENLTAQQLDDIERIQGLPDNILSPAAKQARIQEIVEGTRKALINWAWETSGLSTDGTVNPNDYDPDDIAFSRSFLENLSFGGATASGTSDITGDGAQASSGGGFNFVTFLNEARDIAQKAIDATRPQKPEGVHEGRTPGHTPVGAGELVDYLFEMDDRQFREIQLAAYRSGIYEDSFGNAMSIEEVPFGERDDRIVRAFWNQAIRESMAAARLGETVYVEDVIDIATHTALERRRRTIEDMREEARFTREAGAARGTNAIVQTSDPRTIIQAADQMAQQILGRNATPEERELLIQAIQTGERKTQVARAQLQAEQAAAESRRAADLLDREADLAERRLDALEEEERIRSGSITDREVIQRENDENMRNYPGAIAATRRDQEVRDQRIERANEEAGVDEAEQALEQAAGAGGGLNITEVESFDPNAYIEDYLRTNNKEEVRGKEMMDTFNTFLSALSSPVGGV